MLGAPKNKSCCYVMCVLPSLLCSAVETRGFVQRNFLNNYIQFNANGIADTVCYLIAKRRVVIPHV